SFHLRYTFPTAGDYQLFADTAPKGAGSQVLLARLKIAGKAPPKYDVTKAPAAERALEQPAGPLRVILTPPEDGAIARKTFRLMAKVTDAGGQPATLQPYLGAMGHLILIHQDGEAFVHSHPDESSADEIRRGVIPFITRFPKPGTYRGWAQFQHGGKVE